MLFSPELCSSSNPASSQTGASVLLMEASVTSVHVCVCVSMCMHTCSLTSWILFVGQMPRYAGRWSWAVELWTWVSPSGPWADRLEHACWARCVRPPKETTPRSGVDTRAAIPRRDSAKKPVANGNYSSITIEGLALTNLIYQQMHLSPIANTGEDPVGKGWLSNGQHRSLADSHTLRCPLIPLVWLNTEETR